ncbi:MAG: flagellar hook-basal body complex protein, partial [Bdellovibrionales bacterium]|nr:flagellar hook-basal body complex protein [Bdellovibrionales bacterium]
MSHGVALATTANNVSNANTTAYKSQRTEFQNLLAENLGGKYSTETTRFGNGSIASDVFTIQNQGVIEDTDRALDFAINGEGFFVVNDGTDTLYTRAGNFRIDSDGNLVDSDGRFVQGFTAASPDTLIPLNTSDIGSTSSPTTVVNMFGNVNASAELVAAADIPTAPATFNELTAASSFTTAVEVFDSLGARHPVTL